MHPADESACCGGIPGKSTVWKAQHRAGNTKLIITNKVSRTFFVLLILSSFLLCRAFWILYSTSSATLRQGRDRPCLNYQRCFSYVWITGSLRHRRSIVSAPRKTMQQHTSWTTPGVCRSLQKESMYLFSWSMLGSLLNRSFDLHCCQVVVLLPRPAK